MCEAGDGRLRSPRPNALARLPVDVLETLIDAVDLPELRALALTCYSLREIVQSIGWPALERRLRLQAGTLRLLQSGWSVDKRATFAWCAARCLESS